MWNTPRMLRSTGVLTHQLVVPRSWFDWSNTHTRSVNATGSECRFVTDTESAGVSKSVARQGSIQSGRPFGRDDAGRAIGGTGRERHDHRDRHRGTNAGDAGAVRSHAS